MLKLKKILVFLLLGLFTFTILGCTNTPFEYNNDDIQGFASYDELESYLEENMNSTKNVFYSSSLESADSVTQEGSVPSATDDQTEERDYSKTNNQVEGVEESDRILTDGYYIYVLSGNKFFIVNADSLDIEYSIVNLDHSEIDYQAYEPYTYSYYTDMYLYNDYVVLISSYYEMIPDVCTGGWYYDDVYTEDGEVRDSSDVEDSTYVEQTYQCYRYKHGTKIQVLNVADKDDVTQTRELILDSAYLIETRMIEEQLYVVLNNSMYSWYGYDEDNFVPTFKDSVKGSEFEMIPASDIYVMPNQGDSFNFLTLVSFDITSYEAASIKAYLGSSWQLYMSLNNLYTIINTYHYDEATNFYDYKTFVVRFEIEAGELNYKAMGEIEGYPLNQFSMDEYDGVFRIATTGYSYEQTDETFTWKIDNFMFLLDATSEGEMTLLSHMSGLGKPGERIYSARFVEDIAYLVTFEQIDPLYKIDLSDPENPFVAGELEEEGVSDYLHVISDDLMLGVGRAVDNSGGWTNFTGVKISLYDTTGDDPVNLETYLVEGEYSYTNVMWDHKAFLSFTPEDADFTYVGIPVYEYLDDKYSQSLYLFKVHHSGDLEYLTKLSHIVLDEEEHYEFFDSIERAVIIENHVFTVSYASISKWDMNQDFLQVGQTTLNEEYYYRYYYGFWGWGMAEVMID